MQLKKNSSLQNVLEYRHLPFILAAIAFVSMLGTLQKDFGPMDDLRFRAKLLKPSQIPERLFDTGLVTPDSSKLPTALSYLHSGARTKDDIKKMIDYGTCPWWTYEELRFSQYRPLDSLTHWLDYQIYPDSPALMRVHNLIWFAAVIFIVSILYRKLLPIGWAAALAAVFYFLDNSNYLPAMWIANRNLLISVVFSILCILCHHKWRSTNSPVSAFASIICLTAALLATEAGIAVFAFLLAYALFLDNSKLSKKVFSLIPAVLIILIWRTIYNSLGHGAYGGGFIIDPGREFLRFVFAVLERGPVLLAAQFAGLPPEIINFYHDSMKMNAWLFAAVFLILVFIVLLPLLRKDKLARFWFAAMLFCVVPVCATMPMNRNLLFIAIAVFGLIAQFISLVFNAANNCNKKSIYRILTLSFCVIFLTMHIAVAAGARIFAAKTISSLQKQFSSTMDVGILPGLENQDLVIVNAPNPFTIFFMPTFMAYNHQPMPRAIRVLAPGFIAIDVTRTDDKTVILNARTNSLLSSAKRSRGDSVFLYDNFNRGYRDRRFTFSVGQTIKLPRMTAEILSVDGKGLPKQVRFSFPVSLDDSSLRWLKWDKSKFAYIDFTPPAVGETVIVPGPFNH